MDSYFVRNLADNTLYCDRLHMSERLIPDCFGDDNSKVRFDTTSSTILKLKTKPIIDTHQHLWDLSTQKLTWLTQMPSILNQSFRTEEYSAATHGLNVKAVYMEVDVVPEEEIVEGTRILELVDSGTSTTVAAVIGGRVASSGFAKYLGKFTSYPGMKGVRQVLHLQDPGYCLQELFVRNVNLLGERGKTFDLCMRPTDLNDGVKLATQCPDTRFILDHCGCPDLKSFRKLRAREEVPSHTADEWKRSIQAFAKCPNVICKISGVIESLPDGADASDLAPAVTHCLESFGPDRVVFGSNWPVCLLGGPFKQWVEFLSQIIEGTPEADQRKLWFENAVNFYSLQV